MGHSDAIAGTPVTESARVSELVLLSERGQDTVTLCSLVPQLIERGYKHLSFPYKLEQSGRTQRFQKFFNCMYMMTTCT